MIVIILSLHFFFGIQHLGKFITADEHYWVYERIPQYWDAIADGKWKKTLINDKPGISLALISGIGLLSDSHPETLCKKSDSEIVQCDVIRSEKTLVAFRLPLLIANTLLLLYIFWILSKLYDARTALLATSFITLSPILIGMTQIVNPDSLLWSFGTATLLSFLALLKFREKKFIFLSGALLGFAILSKYIGSFLLPFFTFLIIANLFFQKDQTPETIRKMAKENIIFLLSVIVIGMLIMTLFLPALWLNPSILGDLLSGGEAYFSFLPLAVFLLFSLGVVFCKEKIIGTILKFTERIQAFSLLEKIVSGLLLTLFITLIVGRILFPEWEIFSKIPFDLKDLYSSDKPDKTYFPNIIQAIFLELNPLVFSIAPLTLILFLGQLLSNILPRKIQNQEEIATGHFENFSLLLFIFFFLIAILLSEILATARYLILLYPIIAILAASALAGFSQVFQKWLLLGTILILITSTACAAPFYFNYTNFLLPQEKIIHHSWGYGGYEAAQYLNSLPDAQNLLVWSDYYGICEFFKGKCVTMEYEAAAGQPFDYAVLSHRGRNLYRPEHSRWQKQKNLQMSAAYTESHPAWQLLIDNRPENFVKVVKIAK